MKTITVLFHNIDYEYFHWDGVADAEEVEHIAYCIVAGFSEGELNRDDPEEDGIVRRGYWRINNDRCSL